MHTIRPTFYGCHAYSMEIQQKTPALPASVPKLDAFRPYCNINEYSAIKCTRRNNWNFLKKRLHYNSTHSMCTVQWEQPLEFSEKENDRERERNEAQRHKNNICKCFKNNWIVFELKLNWKLFESILVRKIRSYGFSRIANTVCIAICCVAKVFNSISHISTFNSIRLIINTALDVSLFEVRAFLVWTSNYRLLLISSIWNTLRPQASGQP